MKLSRIRVAAGYVLFLIVLGAARPDAVSMLAALPFALLGELIRLWASGHIEKTKALATGGPYAHTRNPLYLGSVLLALGAGIATKSPMALAALIFYFSLFYPAIMREEAAFLREKFGEGYAAWAREVPMFLPRATPGGPRASRFDWTKVGANREWRTAIALPLVLLLLWARGRYLP
jgi:protein-S-isoprenylcysteine O-methyltransferase Ste14